MVSNRMTDGVGKKIVDALKKQSDSDVLQPQFKAVEHIEEPTTIEESAQSLDFIQQDNIEDETNEPEINAYQPEFIKPVYNFTANVEQPAIQITSIGETFTGDLDDFELPSNVAVLRQLISKLPANVSKQTGAQIIKQTMEALGISMKAVLQEAQQVQEHINASARECQNNISEYKRQISVLENQTQKLNRQYSMVNDIISLFIQAN